MTLVLLVAEAGVALIHLSLWLFGAHGTLLETAVMWAHGALVFLMLCALVLDAAKEIVIRVNRIRRLCLMGNTPPAPLATDVIDMRTSDAKATVLMERRLTQQKERAVPALLSRGREEP